MMAIPESWRYTPVRDKSPYLPDWQNRPHTIEQIEAPGYGLLLGPISGGVVALDFDGAEAIDHFEQNLMPIEALPTTVMWTSGKPQRFQAAFWVDEDAWPLLRTFKTGPDRKLEFRWAGGQSVLPPSPHPETGNYEWLLDPEQVEVAELPYSVLEWWVAQSTPRSVPVEPAQAPRTVSEEEVAALLADLKRHYPTLGYDEWMRVSFAVCKHLGKQRAIDLMRSHYPETKAGEYSKLLWSNYSIGPSPGLGSVVHMIRQQDPTYRDHPEKKLKSAFATLRRAKR
ncbi:hypothetical protein GAY31_20060 [Azospirillum brasilense]|nr:hypothetical protein [Azospirillum brasilense]